MKLSLKQTGFSLVELLVSLAVGAIIFTGIIGLLIASDETVDETLQQGELQENGRIAMSLISRDIKMAGYWGNFTGMAIHEAAGADVQAVRLNETGGKKVAVPADCVGGGMNNGTFFIEDSDFYFRNLWGNHANQTELYGGCINNAKIGSDTLQIKRVKGEEVDSGDEIKTRYYFISTENQGVFYAGSDPTPDMEDGLISEYLHHIYYVAEETRGDYLIPVLQRKYLYKNESSGPNEGKLKAYNLVEGIEQLGFLYGVDTDDDGTVNYFASAEKIPREVWENEDAAILAVRIHVLVRALSPDAGYQNNNVYDLGSYSFTANDNYRRMLFISTVSILNSGTKLWRS
ncbi:PilW family protein [Gayadomonas joobiniege]|uniref:PilW family protein n=1 Tax=Gayadomonas joobiniege TaxID=1234606 RepID=UPI00036C3C08|nr:PilW family protein [Gayadomonas joobiniege]